MAKLYLQFDSRLPAPAAVVVTYSGCEEYG
jgi:hypothetical protein